MSPTKPIEVASVAAFDPAGRLLFGKRLDNGRWVLPGGHIEPGESPRRAAVRELLEEAGLTPEALTELGSETVRDGLVVHAFRADVNGKPTGENDPDEECSEWKFVDVTGGVPSEILENLHSPKNVVLGLLGLQTRLAKSARDLLAHAAFKAWFGDSKIVHPDGKPMTLYRGTRKPGDSKGYLGTESYTESPDVASIYAGTPPRDWDQKATYQPGANVFAVHLHMHNPLRLPHSSMRFGDYLRALQYGKPNGITHDEATKVLNYLVNRKVGKVKAGDFNYEIHNEDDLDNEEDFELWSNPLSVLRYGFKADADFETADRLHVDTFALVDAPRTKIAAERLGHDGIIHGDVMDGAEGAAPELLGKPHTEMAGLKTAWNKEATHLTYRPFKPEQVKSVTNEGHYDASNPDMMKAEGDPVPAPDPIMEALLGEDPYAAERAIKGPGVRPEHLRQAASQWPPGATGRLVLPHPAVDRTVLDQIASDIDHKYLWRQVAKHPQHDADNLRTMANTYGALARRDPEYAASTAAAMDLSWALATSKLTPSDVLHQAIINHRHTWGLVSGTSSAKELFAHPNVSPETMSRYVQDVYSRNDTSPYKNIEASQTQDFLDDPRISRDALNHVVAARSYRNVLRAFKNPNLDPSHIDELLNDPSPQILEEHAALASNPALTEGHVGALVNRALANENYRFLRQAIIEHPNVTSQHLHQILSGADPDWEWWSDKVLEHPKLTHDTLRHVMANPDEARRGYVAGSLPSELLDLGLKDPSPYVRSQTLWHNKNVTEAHRMEALGDPSSKVRNAAAASKNLTPALAQHILEMPPDEFDAGLGGKIQLGAFVHKATTPEARNAFIARQVSHGASPKELSWYADRPETPPEALKTLGEHFLAAPLRHPNDRDWIALGNNIAEHKATPIETLHKFFDLQDPTHNRDFDDMKALVIKNHPDAGLIDRGLAESADSEVMARIISSPGLNADHIRKLSQKPDLAGYRHTMLAGNPNTPPDVLDRYMHYELDRGAVDYHKMCRILENPNVSESTLRTMAQTPVNFHLAAYREKAQQKLDFNHPDQTYKNAVNVRVGKGGVGRLRKIRDLILLKDKKNRQVPPKDLPPGDWSAGRLPNGNISADQIQAHIDQIPPSRFNYSFDTWDGAQRHNDQPSKVFQLNLADHHITEMKAQGVWGTFRQMHDATKQSSHPVNDHTIGWVRYTGNPKTKGIMVDEVQSDFGQSFVKQASGQARDHALQEAVAQRMTPEQTTAHVNAAMQEASSRAESAYPDDHFKKISNIVFGGRHPNEVVAEAFVQHLRDKKHYNLPVEWHTPATKAPLSGLSPERPLPGHFSVSYNDVPKKLGAEPSTYGTIPTQTDEELKGKPTWQLKVRKTERRAVYVPLTDEDVFENAYARPPWRP